MAPAAALGTMAAGVLCRRSKGDVVRMLTGSIRALASSARVASTAAAPAASPTDADGSTAVKVTTASGIAGPQSPSTRTLAPQYLLGLGEDALMDIAKGMGYPGFRGRQIHNALYDMRKASISDMSQLPVGLRTDLEAAGHETGRVAPLQVVAAPDGTKKVLLQLWCGSVIEAVGIPEEMEDTRAAANAAEGYPLYEDGDELLEGSDVEYGGVGGGGASGERDTKDIQVVYDDDDEYGGVGGGTSGERDEENMQVIVDLDEAEDDDGWVRLGKMKTQREQKAAGTRRSRKDKAVKARAQAAEEKAEERTTASTKLDHRRFTVCVSSQVGCAMRCSFCATGRQGFRRNLTSAEIVNQVLALEALFHRRATNVVFMGMGEPLLNLREVLRAHRCLNRDVGIGGRSFTISTVGVPNALSKLAAHRLQATLAVSLHAPDQATRERLVPSAKAYPMEALLADCKLYKETTGRRVTFEYTLLAGENDSPAQAKALAKLLRSHVGRGCHINLLPWNPVGGGDEAVVHARPSRSAVKRFTDALTLEKGITHTVRRTRGLEADAACGQLTGSFERKQPSTRATVSQGAGAGSSVLPAKPLDVVRYTHTAFT